MNLYRFSPITSEDTFNKALEYITAELDTLSQKLFDTSLPITTLKIFAHYPDEYEYLHTIVFQMGPQAAFSSETSLYVQVEKEIHGHHIQYVGVRIVDPYRLHVGCGDYEIPNFSDFKNKGSNKTPLVREFSDDMLEVWHPDFDVLGYVVATPL